MPDTVNDVAVEAASMYLNDPAQSSYTTVKLLPFIKSIYLSLGSDLVKLGAPLIKEVSALQTVAALAVVVPAIADLVEPIALGERATGSTDLFTDMDRRDWEPEEKQTEMLRWWVWREQQIQLLGATRSNQVKVKYKKRLAALVDASSVIAIDDVKDYLAARTSEVVSAMNKNVSRAEYCNSKAEYFLEEIKSRYTKQNQGITVRRLPYSRR